LDSRLEAKNIEIRSESGVTKSPRPPPVCCAARLELHRHDYGVSNIWSLPLDGGKPVQLTDFKADQIFWFDFSRDGKQLAVSRGVQTSDVILIPDFR
jgi:hypothetical protein